MYVMVIFNRDKQDENHCVFIFKIVSFDEGVYTSHLVRFYGTL